RRMALRVRLSSVSAKIILAFFAILAIFGGVTAYGAFTMRHLGDQLLRLASDYLTLQVEIQDLQTRPDNLLRTIEDRSTDDKDQPPAFLKIGLDNARILRRKAVERARDHAKALGEAETLPSEAAFLHEVTERLTLIDNVFGENESLFDDVWGPPRAG